MTTEVANTQENQQDETAQSAMMAGFNKVRGDEPPAEDPPKETTATEQAQPEAKTEQPKETEQKPTDATAPATTEGKETKPVEKTPEPAVEEDQIVPGLGLKASEVKALLADAAQVKTIREALESNSSKVFGKFGELQRTINELKNTSPGKPLQFTEEDFEDLKREYPDLADLQLKAFNKMLGRLAPAKPTTEEPNPEQRSAETPRETTPAISPEIELKLLTIAHPDWRSHRKAPEFEIWLSTLPPDVATEVRSSQDSTFLAEAFTAHKAWKQHTADAKKAADEAAAAKQKTEKRLEGGLTPNGVTPPAPPPPTASSAMQAGFNKVRKR